MNGKGRNGGSSALFWVGITAAGVASAWCLYKLYVLFNNEEELGEERLLQIQELKEEVEEAQELSPELAIQIMAMTNKFAEEIMKKMKPDIDEKRRAVFKQPEEYEKICIEMFECKEYAYNSATTKILKEFGFSQEELQKVLQTINPYEMEKKIYDYEKPSFEDCPVPDKNQVKEAFMYYGKKFSEEMKDFHKEMSKSQMDPNNQEYIIFRLLVVKMKIDDELYFKYKYIEAQIRYLLYEYNLLDDPEVKRVHNNINQFDDMFGMSN
jgi:hypothetical protein